MDKPVKTRVHLGVVLHPTPRLLKEAMGDVEGFNAKFAVIVTRLVGTMWCAYAFTLIALISLPKILIEAHVVPASDVPHFFNNAGLILIVAWVAQTFIQLVLLSIIMVGQNVQSLASDKRAEGTYDDAVVILDRLDVHTQGGIADLKADLEKRLDAIEAGLGRTVPSGKEPK